MEEANLASITQAHIDRAFAAFEASSLHGMKNAAHQVKSQYTWKLNHRMRVVGATARWKYIRITDALFDMSIDFNVDVFSRMPSYEQYNTTTHEIAHLIDMSYYRVSSNHGYRWQSIDIAMGGSGERCHKMDVKRNIVKRLVVEDTVTGKIYQNVTLRNYNKAIACSPGRYKVLEEKTLNRTPESLLSA